MSRLLYEYYGIRSERGGRVAVKQWILLGIALFLTVDSILRAFRTTLNLGSFLMYCITGAVWVYALFFRQIDAFCAHGIGRALKYVFFAGCLFVVGMIAFLASAGVRSAADGQERAVIVLGASVRGSRVSAVLAQRLDAALRYYEKNPDVLIVVSGGQGPDEDIPEAQAMADYLTERGVPADQILEESQSESTQENFAFSRRLLEENGVSPDEPVAYVTNDFHIYRAGHYASLAGFSDARALSAPTSIGVWLQCYLREICGVLYLWAFV